MVACGGLIHAAGGAQFPGSSRPAQTAPATTPTTTPPAPAPARRTGKILPLSPFPSRTHWTLALNNQLTAQPAFDQRFGYFPIDGDRIAAYELTQGTRLWMVSATPRSALAVGDGLLFVDQESKLSALRTSDGSTAWTVPHSETLVTPLVWDHGWLIAATATELIAIRGEDGTIVWRQPIAGPRAPSLAGDRVYVSVGDGRVLALRIDTGTMIWERKLGGGPNEILALDDGIFVGSTDNFLYCLKPRDGTIEWRWRTGADVVSRPTFDADRIYFVSQDNMLRALNRSNGVQQWKRALPFRPLWTPVKAADTVIVTGILGPPLAFFIKDGAPAGELSLTPSTPLLASAVVPEPFHLFAIVRAGLGPGVIAVLPGAVPVDLLPGQKAPVEPPAFPTAPGTSEIVAAPYALQSGTTLGPMMFLVRRTIDLGANVVAVSRLIEPEPIPLAGPPIPLPPPPAPKPGALLVPIIVRPDI